MNEAIFLIHICLVLLFLGLALRLGRGGLTAYVCLSAVLANFFVVKQMELCGFHVTCSDVFAVGSILGLNLMQEIHGREAARDAMRTSLACLVFFACMSQIHLLYRPSPFDAAHDAYRAILSCAPRIVAASIGVYYIVQRFDLMFFALLKKIFPSLGVRLGVALLASQALDTALFSFFGLYGLVSSLMDIMAISFLVKCSIIACGSPIAAFLRRYACREAA